MSTENPLWDLIQSYMDAPTHRYPPKPADLARETGVSDQVISKWKSRPTLPTAEQLMKFAHGTGLSYLELLTAALQGKGYLPLTPVQLAVSGRVDSLEWAKDAMGFQRGSQDRKELDEAEQIGMAIAAKRGTSKGRAEAEQQDRDAQNPA